MSNAPLLEMRNIQKDCFGNQVLTDINLTLREGEVLGLCGENGAGKSTLMKILFGMDVIRETGGFGGEILLNGEKVEFATPFEALAAGIGMVHQEFSLIPGFTATENILLNREPQKHSVLSEVFGERLNTLNRKLTADAASARREAAESRKANKELTEQVTALSGQVAAGSIIKAHNFMMYAYNNNDKITDKANRVARFLVNLTLVENELAEHGPVRVYVRVTDPDGNLLSDGHGTTFTFNGETLEATASREVDYQGKEVDLGIYINNIGSFMKGVYTVNAYTTQAQLGHGELLLR